MQGRKRRVNLCIIDPLLVFNPRGRTLRSISEKNSGCKFTPFYKAVRSAIPATAWRLVIFMIVQTALKRHGVVLIRVCRSVIFVAEY